MPPTTPLPPITDRVTKVKLFEDDHNEAIEIQQRGETVFRGLTLQQIVREAVRVGLPVVRKRYDTLAATMAAPTRK